MDGCSLNLAVSALACAIARDKSADEITLLSLLFTQIGDSLATIAGGDTICNNNYSVNNVNNNVNNENNITNLDLS